jgi:hypothetical protein
MKRMMMGMKQSKHFLEDFKQFRLLDLSVSRLVDSLNESIDFLLGDLSFGLHVAECVVDEVEDFGGFEAVAVVSIVLFEYGIDGISELLVTV